MTHRPIQLETFDTMPARQQIAVAETEYTDALEASRISGYDTGYKTGWDDALRQSREEDQRIGAEFARNLRDLSFTYHEARAHVLRSLDGLLDEISVTFLPRLMADSLGGVLKETISAIAEDAANAPILIRAAPSEAERLRAFLHEETGLPVQVVDEPSLAEGQAHLKLGAEERQVDLTEPLHKLSEAIRALRSVTERTLDARRAG